ncbi:EI24 domain-containing protein [Lacibacterium aquatile]|uniref:EI24 domain-containing protein n=1 Tax=Lacibacterium aquatile TaxID=1168082 RepID=A0ABW5DVD0_9PROT
MFSAFSKAIGQLSDPKTRGALWLGIGGALLVMVILGVGASVGLTYVPRTGMDWLDGIIFGAGILSVMMLVWLFFPATVIIVTSLLLERVARAVEARHYPTLPPPRDVPLSEDIKGSVVLALKALGLNILFLPAYLFLGPLSPLLFIALNGYLLGREYFQQVAMRRLSLPEVEPAFRASRSRYWMAGGLIAALGTIPIVNLLIPVLATALFIHLFQTRRSGS